MRLTTRLLSMSGEVASTTLEVGRRLSGKVGSYKILEQFTKDRDVWKAVDENARHVVIKRAPPHLLKIQREILQMVKNHMCVRQMIDIIESDSSLVLEYLDNNLLDVCNRKRLESSEVKFVARTILEALAVLHEKGFVHTDVKPDNILINYGSDATLDRFSRVALGDCGDVQPNAEKTHVISAAVFRSPEAQLNLKWGPPTDIWSLGVTLISAIFGGNWHIFIPAKISFDDEHYGFWVLVEQIRRFGPVNANYVELLDDERLTICNAAIAYIKENRKWLPFSICEDDELAPSDRDFIAKMMKFDPRDRPTAKELLQDAWFKQ